jgi:DHA1 family tetracycline resistance protein-like MFS transporter
MDMPAKRAAHMAIFFTVLIDLIGFGILIPILQPFATRVGASVPQAMMLMGIYSFMQFIFSPVLGRISDRVGRRPVILASLIGTMLGYLIIAAAANYSGTLAIAMLFLARMVTGVCGASFSTAQASLADITAPEKRAAVMGMIGAAFGIGFVLGPVIGGLTSHTPLGPSLPFYIAAAMSLANAFFCWRRLPETLPPERRAAPRARSSIMATVRRMQATGFPVILGGNFLVITAFSVMTTAWVLFLQERHHMSEMTIGLVFGFIGMIAVFIQGGLIRRIVRNGNERTLALAGAVLMTASLALLPVAAPWLALLTVSGLMSVGNSLATPTLNALASQCGTVENQGETMGAMTGAGSLGRFIGPFLSAGLLYLLPGGFEQAFWMSSGLMACAAVTIFMIRRRRAGGGATPQA